MSAATYPAVQAVCRRIAERVRAQGMKGKSADREALSMLLGAAVGFNITGDDQTTQHLMLVATLVSASGMAEVTRIANDNPTAQVQP